MSGWAAAAQVGGDVLSSGLNYAFGQAASRRAYDRSIKYLEESPSAQVAGLRKAGLNPILAAGNLGSGQAGGNFPSNVSSDIGGAVASSRQLSQQRDLIDSQISKQTAEARESASRQWLNEATLHNLIPAQAASAQAAAFRDHSQGVSNQATALGIQLDNVGRANTAKFEENMGGASQAARFGFEAIKALK